MALTWVYNGSIYTATSSSGNDVVTIATEGNILTNANHLFSGEGDDYAALDFGIDAYYAGYGNDTGYGGEGKDYLYGGGGNDLLYGDNGDDEFYAGEGMDAMYGGAGNDWLDSTTNDGQSDNLNGGNGHDTYVIYDSIDVISGESAYATSTSRDSIRLYATSYNMNANVDSRAVENLTVMSNNHTTVTGNMLDNSIFGGNGNDSINGDAGNDTINGGHGDDRLIGSIGNDLIRDEDGNDRIEGSSGNDSIDGGKGADLIYGGDQADTLQGGTQGDTIYGGAGNDRILGDFNDADNFGDTLYGDAGDDRIEGGGGSDYMNGGGGNDTIILAGTNADHAAGGVGNDVYEVRNAGSTVSENANEGYDTVRTNYFSASIANYHNVEAMFYIGSTSGIVTFEGSTGNDVLSIYTAASGRVLGYAGNDDMAGSDGADVLLGGEGNDIIQGLGGNDTIDGEAGNDWLYGGLGNDRYLNVSYDDVITESANAGTDTVVAVSKFANGYYYLGANIENGEMAGSNLTLLVGNTLNNKLTASGLTGATLRGMDGNDSLIGKETSDLLDGGNGNDTLTGNGGNDTLNGGSGNDLMQGGAGNDTYHVDSAGDQVVESIFGSGIDTVRVSVATWTLAADHENLIFTGAGGFAGTGSDIANRIEGGSGNDTLKGLGGNDVIVGKGGSDKVYGGAGADDFVFNNNGVANNARVYDFAGGVDMLVLDADAAWSYFYVDADTTRFTSATGGTVIVDGLDLGHVWNSVEYI